MTERLSELAAAFGSRGLLVHGRSLARSGKLALMLANVPSGCRIMAYEHKGGEPDLDQLACLLDYARQERVDWVAGVGGGSVLDLSKAGAGLLHSPGDLAAYHDGLPPERPGVPFVAAPTTAGTGSEATVNCVLTNPRTGEKKSIKHSQFMPSLVVLDAELLLSAPPAVRAAAGMDAITQAVEVYFCRQATWLSDTLARQALAQLAAGIREHYVGDDPAAAEKMLLGSYCAGLALSMARLGVVHGLAHPLGARYHQPHGLVCGVCLPLALEFNRQAAGARYAELSGMVGSELAEWTRALLAYLNLRNPFAGAHLCDEVGIIRETLASGSTAANPRPVAESDVCTFLEGLFIPAKGAPDSPGP